MKHWLVAHRGASHEEKENTLKAFIAATKYPVAMIEFDVRVTADNIAVIHHDAAVDTLDIATTNYSELKKHNPDLAIFEDFVNHANNLPLMVELKGAGAATHVAPYLLSHPKSFATSFMVEELQAINKLGVDGSRLFLAKHIYPNHLQQSTLAYGFGGITVNKWYLTPFFYWRAQKNKLNIFVYTVNSKMWARIIRTLYPKALICTDRPGVLQKLS